MSDDYPFDILGAAAETGYKPSLLESRPFVQDQTVAPDAQAGQSRMERDAEFYRPGEGLRAAINAAIALGQPLLLSGEPGTGKSSAAYYIARKLDLGPVLAWTVRSGAQASDLAGRYNAVGYLGAELRAQRENDAPPQQSNFHRDGKLKQALESETTRVLLIDEIDKAPRDFPNDLLEQLDQWRIEFDEIEGVDAVQANDKSRPIVVITSNGERALPDAFLRRCVYWNIEMNHKRIEEIVALRVKNKVINLPEDVVKGATKFYGELVAKRLEKKPSVSELLNWLRVLETQGVTEAPTSLDEAGRAAMLKTATDQRLADE